MSGMLGRAVDDVKKHYQRYGMLGFVPPELKESVSRLPNMLTAGAEFTDYGDVKAMKDGLGQIYNAGGLNAQAAQGYGNLGAGALGALGGPLLSAGMVKKAGGSVADVIDRTKTGWTFKDVKGKPKLSRSENKHFNNFPSGETVELPIRSLNATQAKVNSDYMDPVTGATDLPTVVKKGGEYFVYDGHHRITAVAAEGGQNARVKLIDFDDTDKTAPLLDYIRQQDAQVGQMSDEDLLSALFEPDPLPMDTPSRMKRAEEMGFDTDVFHGTANDVSKFTRDRLGAVTKSRGAKNAVWLSDSPQTASGYAQHAESEQVQNLIDASQAAERRGDWDAAHDLIVEAEKLESAGGPGGANVIPAKIRGNLMEYDADGVTLMDLDDGQLGDLVDEAMQGGYDGLKIMNFSDEASWGNYAPTTHYAIFDPKNIRSRHAKFDPAKKDSADLLASIGGAGLLGLGLTQRQDNDRPR